eukprot:4825531-Amphidinium_carterae.1
MIFVSSQLYSRRRQVRRTVWSSLVLRRANWSACLLPLARPVQKGRYEDKVPCACSTVFHAYTNVSAKTQRNATKAARKQGDQQNAPPVLACPSCASNSMYVLLPRDGCTNLHNKRNA